VNQSSNVHCISKRMKFMITNDSLVYMSSGKILYRHVFMPNISTYMQLVPYKYLQNIRNKALICYCVCCLTQAYGMNSICQVVNLSGPTVKSNIPADLYNKAQYYESQQIPSGNLTMRDYTDPKPFSQNVARGKT